MGELHPEFLDSRGCWGWFAALVVVVLAVDGLQPGVHALVLCYWSVLVGPAFLVGVCLSRCPAVLSLSDCIPTTVSLCNT